LRDIIVSAKDVPMWLLYIENRLQYQFAMFEFVFCIGLEFDNSLGSDVDVVDEVFHITFDRSQLFFLAYHVVCPVSMAVLKFSV
jgi:hypothetical protein